MEGALGYGWCRPLTRRQRKWTLVLFSDRDLFSHERGATEGVRG